MTIVNEERYIKHHRKLYNFCLKLTKDINQAEDLFQDTWLKAFENISRYNCDNEFEPWLFTVCLNLYRDRYRRNRFIRKISLDFTKNETKDFVIESIIDKGKTSEEKFIEDERKGYLKMLLDDLNDKYRLPLILYYYNEYSYSRIAQILNIKEGTVKSRISTGKSKLKERMVSYERGRI